MRRSSLHNLATAPEERQVREAIPRLCETTDPNPHLHIALPNRDGDLLAAGQSMGAIYLREPEGTFRAKVRAAAWTADGGLSALLVYVNPRSERRDGFGGVREELSGVRWLPIVWRLREDEGSDDYLSRVRHGLDVIQRAGFGPALIGGEWGPAPEAGHDLFSPLAVFPRARVVALIGVKAGRLPLVAGGYRHGVLTDVALTLHELLNGDPIADPLCETIALAGVYVLDDRGRLRDAASLGDSYAGRRAPRVDAGDIGLRRFLASIKRAAAEDATAAADYPDLLRGANEKAGQEDPAPQVS